MRWAKLTLEAHLIKLAARGASRRARRPLANFPRMRARLSVSLHAVSVRRGGKWVLAGHHADASKPASIGRSSGRTAPAKRSCSSCCAPMCGRRPPAAKSGFTVSAAAKSILSEAKSRMAYVGAELQDKYTRYGWNLPVQDLLATGLHGTDLLLSPASRAERTRIEATLRACGLAAIGCTVASYRCPTGRNGSRCSRAPWWRPRTGCAWMSSTTVWTRASGAVSTGCSPRRGRQAALGSWRPIAPATSRRGTHGIIELREGRVRSIRALDRTELARLTRLAGDRTAPAGRDRAPAPPPGGERARPRAAHRRRSAGVAAPFSSQPVR